MTDIISRIILKFTPSTVNCRIQGKPVCSKILLNIAWLFIDKILKIGCSLFVAAWMARYLGPSHYGLYNYAIALVALIFPLVDLGLGRIAIRDIVDKPESKNLIIGTAFYLHFFSGLSAALLAVVFATLTCSENVLVRNLTIVVSGSLIFRGLGCTFDYWFASQIQAKYTVWAQNLSLFVGSILNICLIIWKASLIGFAWSFLAQNALTFFAMIFLFQTKSDKLLDLRYSNAKAKKLLGESWPLIVSGFAIIVYMKIDQIMLANMMGEKALGVYSAAVKISEIGYFIPMAIASSFFPMLVGNRKKYEEKEYSESMQDFFDLMMLVAYLVIIPSAIFAPYIINLIFGTAYSEAGTILRIHIWAFIFVTLGVARSQWLIIEKETSFFMWSTSLGAASNILLNMFLIPKSGGIGAAWSTLISYAIAAYFSSVALHKRGPVFKQQSVALLAPIRFDHLCKKYLR